MPQEQSQFYNSTFYKRQRDQSQASAQAVVPYLISRIKPRSVIDVGCGLGTWLAEFSRQGVPEVLGIDGTYVSREMLQIPDSRFRPANLSMPESVSVTERFDLALSLEVAEHLPAEAADGFVALLTSVAPTVIFSAAIPFQGGVNHINEQWADYWISRFAVHGYLPVDCLRPWLWEDQKVQLCYRQNMFLLTSDQELYERLQAETSVSAWPARMIHADTFVEVINRPLTLRNVLRALPAALETSIRDRLHRSKS